MLNGWRAYLATVSIVALIYAAPDSLKGLAVAALALLFVVVTLPTQGREPDFDMVTWEDQPSAEDGGKPSREKDLSDSQ